MRTRKLPSLLTAVALMLGASWFLAAPASAASMSIRGVEEVKTSAPRSLAATATGGVGEFSSVSLTAGGVGLGTSTCPTLESSCSHSATWNPPSKNGTYDVVATARRRLGGSDLVETARVNVNIPPAAPTNVKAALNDSNVPVVTWSANREPDIIRYEILRSDNNAAYHQTGQVSKEATSWSDSSAKPDVALQYRVRAVRSSPVSQPGVAGPLSAESNTVKVPLPPPPTGPDGAPSQATPDAVPDADGQPGGSPAGPRNPTDFAPSGPNPIDAPNVPPQVTVGPRRDVGFAPLLPYSSAQLPKIGEEGALEPVEAEDGQGLVAPVTLPNSLRRPVVQKSLYIATALLLVVVALHMARAARRLREVTEVE